MILRTGIDLVEISRLETLNPAIRQRFLQRVYTAQELEDSQDALSSLAGRFAVKEAVAKALGCGIGPIAWKEIEIHQGPLGEPVLELHGQARQAALAAGLQTWSISISHTNTHAVAVAVAVGDGSGPGEQPPAENRPQRTPCKN
jgi:holo-[acyl-carrier protein] synthase